MDARTSVSHSIVRFDSAGCLFETIRVLDFALVIQIEDMRVLDELYSQDLLPALFKIQSTQYTHVPVGVWQSRASAEPLRASREVIADVAGPRQSDLDAKIARHGEVRCALQVLHPPEPFGGT